MASETVVLSDPSRPNWAAVTTARPVRAHIWAARASGPAPVVLLSHGTGGAAETLTWLACEFHDAGFLVASVDHHGNSYDDAYLIEGFAFAWERPRDMSLLLDYIIAEYDVDEGRIGAAGFSLGGYTVAALLGARIDARILAAVFAGELPAPEVPEFPELIRTLRSSYSATELDALALAGSGSLADARVRAGVLLAPAIGRLLDPATLAQIGTPVMVRWGDNDDNTPPEDNAHLYQNLIPDASGKSVGADAGHYVFLGETDDPNMVRPRVAAEAVEFLRSALA